MSRDDGMDEQGIEWLYDGCPHRAGLGLGSWPNNHAAKFPQALTTNLTLQHDSHGPDDGSKTIDYPHFDMSRDDGMDEHGIERLYDGCP
jgi:hypothetical protein